MRTLTCCLSAIVLLVASAAANADAKSEAAARAKAIAPFVEAETVVVAHVDLTKVDPPSLLDLVSRFTPNPPSLLARDKEKAAKQLATAIQAGAKDWYLVVTLRPGDQSWRPTIVGVAPMQPGADVAAIRAALKVSAGARQMADGTLVVSLNHPTEPPGEFHPAKRPELAAAFEAAGDSAAQVALIPPAYVSRVIEELMPQFPKELGGGPTTIVTRGVSWAVAGIDLPPYPAIRLTIKSADAQAAEALRTKLADMLRQIGTYKEVRAVVPKYDEVAGVLAAKVEGDRLGLVLDQQNHGVEKLLSLLTPPIEVAKGRALRMLSFNNLKEIGLAMHNYAMANKSFPPPYQVDKNGKPLLSWRVYVLAFTDQYSLFKQFHLDEPWDSPHNRTLIDKMPSIYRLPMSKTEQGRTNYLLPVGGGAAFEAGKPTYFKDIRDGTANTIMVVEVDDEHSVIWTKPEDLQFDPKDPTKGLARFDNGSFNAVMCDGSAHHLSWPKEPKEIERLRYIFQRADGQPIQW